MRDPEPTARFAFGGIRACRVPGDVDAPLPVGTDRAAAVEVERPMHQVPLGLERSSALVQSRVEHRAALDRVRRRRLLRPVPSDVDPPVTAQRELATADRAHRNRAAGLAVDPIRFRELGRPRLAADIEQVATSGFTLEIDQVDNPGVIGDGLRLNPSSRSTDHNDPALSIGRLGWLTEHRGVQSSDQNADQPVPR